MIVKKKNNKKHVDILVHVMLPAYRRRRQNIWKKQKVTSYVILFYLKCDAQGKKADSKQIENKINYVERKKNHFTIIEKNI